jgi:hypothetical protein
LKALGRYDELIEKNQRTKKVSQVKSKVSGKSGTKRKTDEEAFLDDQFPEE